MSGDWQDREGKTGRFAVVHGGEAARRDLRHGRPFTGLAAEAEQGVRAELAEPGGRAELTAELATRLHAATRLFWGGIQAVADQAAEGDAEALTRLDAYLGRFGWLAGAALRAWAQVGQNEKDRAAQALDYDDLVADMRRRASEAKAEREASGGDDV